MSWSLHIENVAGIRLGDATIHPGVNAVRASNWRGKSSFLSSVETVCGTATPLTDGTDEGRVVLTTESGETTVELVRREGTVVRRGAPYLDDEYDRICADLFAFLDEENEIRWAVRNGGDLEPILTRPLDFENIDERIADRKAERSRVESELERARDAAERLSGLQATVTKLESTLESLREERADFAASQSAESEGESARDELSSARATRETARDRVDRLESTVERLEQKLAERRAELESLERPDVDDVADELESAQSKLRAVERDVELLRSVFEANKRILDEDRLELLASVERDLLSDSLDCWVCGSDVTREEVEARLTELDDRIGDLRAESNSHRRRVEELEATREELARVRRRESDLETEIGDIERTLTERRSGLESARERLANLDERVESLEATVEDTDSRRTDLESDIKYAEAQLADAREDLSATESRAEKRETLETEYDALTDDIRTLRERKDTVKRETRTVFANAVDELVARFQTGFDAARLTDDFELVVARDGRETSLDALSEGERELLGIVVALAGHVAFDVDDRVPILLLDGLGGLASDNLQRLVESVRDRATYLVLTAYPEYEAFDGHELDPSEWRVVSDARAA